MSNAVTIFGDVSDSFKELLAQLEPETNVGQSQVRRLSIRGGVFRKVVGSQEVAELEDRKINVIIVKTAPLSRTYYSKGYTAGETSAPTCWSSNTSTGVPDDSVVATDRQSPTCFNCPQNVKGSGAGESRACRYNQRVALLIADADGNVVSPDVYQLSLPATSIFGDDKQKLGLQSYAKFLTAQNAPLAGIITEIRFDTDSSTPKLCFKPVRPVDESELRLVIEAQKDPETAKLVTMTVKPKDDAGNKLENNAKVDSSDSKPEKEASADDAGDAEDEAIEEPKVKKSTKKTEPVPKQADLASLLDDFDD